MTKRKINRKEVVVYVVLWVALFVAPVVSHYFHAGKGVAPVNGWGEVFDIWKTYAFFFLLFLIHDFILAPLLIYRRKILSYIAAVLCLIGVLVAFQCANRPKEPRGPERPPMERMEMARDDAARPAEMPPPPPDTRYHNGKPDCRPPMIWGEQDVVGVIILILLLGMNLGVKLYFKSEDDMKNLKDLEKENLERQLEFLKYQINPHFLMNTLNNIHALVDINPEGAKESIVELSKLMRYILYKGDNGFLSVEREVKFIQHYLRLMRIRFSDSVEISAQFPQNPPERLVPSLMFISFVENAFKHGISYKNGSFIRIKMDIDGERIAFSVVNSKHDTTTKSKGGIGLANVKKRLDILYADDYQLDIDDAAAQFSVNLNIPLLPPSEAPATAARS